MNFRKKLFFLLSHLVITLFPAQDLEFYHLTQRFELTAPTGSGKILCGVRRGRQASRCAVALCTAVCGDVFVFPELAVVRWCCQCRCTPSCCPQAPLYVHAPPLPQLVHCSKYGRKNGCALVKYAVWWCHVFWNSHSVCCFAPAHASAHRV